MSKQRRLFKLRRAGVVLTREEVKEIKAGRKKLRREMRQQHIYKKRDFEVLCASLGLYFDKRNTVFAWLFHGKGLWVLLGALLLLLAALYLMSLISQMRGFFTINLSNEMFKNGFVLSETVGFEKPVISISCEPAVDVPCISIVQIDKDVDDVDGAHNSVSYFATTFYCRNDGQDTVDYKWDLLIRDESKNLSEAAWVMVFEDGKMIIFAEAGDDGSEEALPARGEDSRGYVGLPLTDKALYPQQFEVVKEVGPTTYTRVIPFRALGESRFACGYQQSVAPGEVHKYTVVIWLEGDDPDTTNEKIQGHLGLNFQFNLIDEEKVDEERAAYAATWDGLKWWK